jgi:hypothetical protein
MPATCSRGGLRVRCRRCNAPAHVITTVVVRMGHVVFCGGVMLLHGNSDVPCHHHRGRSVGVSFIAVVICAHGIVVAMIRCRRFIIMRSSPLPSHECLVSSW